MPDRVVLASNNKGKIRELQDLLPSLKLYSQAAFNVPEAEETGETFIENAIIKARSGAHYSGLPTIADDSGLVVDALKGAPGVHSSRFAGNNASDKRNLEKLLHDLKSIPAQQRTARFICVLVFMRTAQDAFPIIATGVWEGLISKESVGTNGFGYDPVFWLPELNSTSAELSAAKKNSLSHRGQAIRALIKQLQNDQLVG